MEQRNELHQSVSELRQKVTDVREKFDIKHNVQQHMLATVLTAAAVLVLTSITVARSFDR